MDEIKDLFNLDYSTIIIGIFIIILGVDKVIYLLLKVKKTLRIKLGYEEDKETLEHRIAVLEKHDNWQYGEIQKVSNGIDDIKKNLVQKEISDIRWELLNFCSALTSNQNYYNREAFEHIFRTYEDYEKILERNNMSNGYIVESMKVVREIYHNKLANGEFK